MGQLGEGSERHINRCQLQKAHERFLARWGMHSGANDGDCVDAQKLLIAIAFARRGGLGMDDGAVLSSSSCKPYSSARFSWAKFDHVLFYRATKDGIRN